MNARRPSKSAAMFCGTFVLMGAFVATLASFGSGGVQKAGAKPIDADVPVAAVTNVSVAAVSVTEVAAEAAAIPIEPKPFVVASIDPSQTIPPEQAATPSAPEPPANEIKAPVISMQAPDDCLIADICIDQYLWALYQRTPKQDTNRVYERRKVTVKRKGKNVTVTRRFTKLVDADFTWKDPKAALKADMTVMGYAIGGMDRSFKRKLLYMLLAAEEAGLSPGITSAFRDDYRQSIAIGQKAATDRSYHGGSLRGGYGHGLAADIVSVKGATRAQRWAASDRLWKWVDEHGKEFGIGRPYLDRDAPHVAPIDGREYATHYRAPKTQLATADKNKNTLPAAQDSKSMMRTASILPAGALKVVSIDEINARRDQ